MTSKSAAEAFFKVTKPDTPWDRTNDVARQIISDEVSLRDANVSRLRALRAAQPVSAQAPTKKKK
ncbi:hypothetical protein JJJ17_13950 [Paracoccus caeni]|uniref:Uncharacterized protein n=1 Tax=Paracoccus caeni TaxID=657651 RepID=A0A934W0K5_9RHOB|nr:hypothetical protein [Paracoccus caeni]MBK4217035.1 hypothetical protein [Paracoccus caeni]